MLRVCSSVDETKKKEWDKSSADPTNHVPCYMYHAIRTRASEFGTYMYVSALYIMNFYRAVLVGSLFHPITTKFFRLTCCRPSVLLFFLQAYCCTISFLHAGSDIRPPMASTVHAHPYRTCDTRVKQKRPKTKSIQVLRRAWNDVPVSLFIY